MLLLNNLAPSWIKKTSLKKEWHGLRARPSNEYAPILRTLEPGLILNTGHYRNGVLIAPACAEWVWEEIKKQTKI